MRIHFTASVRYALDQIKSSAESSMVFFLPLLRAATVANYQAQTIDLILAFFYLFIRNNGFYDKNQANATVHIRHFHQYLLTRSIAIRSENVNNKSKNE